MLVHAAERRASSALKGKARCVVHHGAADQCLAVWFLLLAAGVQVAEWAVLVVEFFIGAVSDESAVVETRMWSASLRACVQVTGIVAAEKRITP